MRLNLAILSEDLAVICPFSKIVTAPLVRNLKYATLFEAGLPLDEDVLYILDTSQADLIPRAFLNKEANFICIGQPPSALLVIETCNILWTEEQVSKTDLLNKVAERFFFYTHWESSLQRAMALNKPVSRLAELTSPIVRRPIWMWNRDYVTLFSVVDEHLYTLPDDYTHHEEMTPWPLWEVNAWTDDGYIDIDETLAIKEPYMLPSTQRFSYRALAYNLFIGEEYHATVTLEEIGGDITGRDYALIEAFGRILCQGIKRDTGLNMSVTSELETTISKLLKPEYVSKESLASSLASLGWNKYDGFICLVARATNLHYTDEMLMVTAEKTCATLPGVIYHIDHHDIVFIVNTSSASLSQQGAVEAVRTSLCKRKYKANVGVSTLFSDFSLLAHYRQQATDALIMGRQKESASTEKPSDPHDEQDSCAFYWFEDYMLEFLLEKCRTRVLPDTLYPSGLVRLLEYDLKYKTNLAEILDAYLRNNMQVAETSRQLFMHRNTLLNKLKKLEEVLGMNLDDADTRLLLQIAFRIMK